MRRFLFSLPALALSAAFPAAAQQANDFQLPPASPRPDDRTQGPVDPDAPVPSRPRAIATAQPTPTPTPTPSASMAVPSPEASPAPAPPRPAPADRTAPARPAVQASETDSLPDAIPTPETSSFTPVVPSPAPAPGATPSAASPESPFPWLWVALAALAGFAAAALLFRRRRPEPEAPIIEPPVPKAVPPAPEPLAAPLALTIEAIRFDRSLFNATVSYRITARNRGPAPLDTFALEADLVTASSERPAEEQLATPDQSLEPRHRLEQLRAGESKVFEGQVRLPLSQATAIRQGSVGLLVPLLRVRATAAATAPVAATLVLGQGHGPSARPQPFRLDDPPRSYAPLAQRLLDAVPAPA